MFTASAFAQYTGVISVDSVEAQPGQSFQVPVRLSSSNLAFSGLTIPLHYDSDYLSVDSVSFIGSIMTEEMATGVLLEPAEGKIRITMLPRINDPVTTPTIDAEQGIVGTIFCRLDQSAPPGVIGLDSINVETIIAPDLPFWERVEISDPSGMFLLFPDFVPGAVKVLLPTGVNDGDNSGLPQEFALAQNYPNPFNPVTSIEFALPQAGHVELKVFNVLGQTVSTLVDGFETAGVHRVEFDAGSLPSGIYFYRISHSEGTQTKKMALVK
jgi:hypothetical protein